MSTLLLWVFPSCSLSWHYYLVLSEWLSLSQQDCGMMPLKRTAIYQQFC